MDRMEAPTGPGIAGLLAASRARLPARPGPAATAAIQRDGGFLVDIRPERDRAVEGEIEGAVVIDRNVLEWRLDPRSDHRIPEVDELFATTETPVLVVVCNEGYASSLAAATLQDLGWTGATDLDGGFRAWAAAGLPTVPGPSASR